MNSSPRGGYYLATFPFGLGNCPKRPAKWFLMACTPEMAAFSINPLFCRQAKWAIPLAVLYFGL